MISEPGQNGPDPQQHLKDRHEVGRLQAGEVDVRRHQREPDLLQLPGEVELDRFLRHPGPAALKTSRFVDRLRQISLSGILSGDLPRPLTLQPKVLEGRVRALPGRVWFAGFRCGDHEFGGS